MPQNIDSKKDKLKQELEKLRYEFKVDLPKRIAEARAYGDLRENAEYDAARERQAFVKARIAQLSEQLSRLDYLKVNDIPDDSIAYGSRAMVIDIDSDDRIEFIMVSTDEVNPSEGKISSSSPIGAALTGKTAGDEVEVIIPAGKKRYYIEKVVTIHGNELEKKYPH